MLVSSKMLRIRYAQALQSLPVPAQFLNQNGHHDNLQADRWNGSTLTMADQVLTNDDQ